MKTLPSRPAALPLAALTAAALAVGLLGAKLVDRHQRRAREAEYRQEVKVRALVDREPLANMGLRPARDGLTGLLSRVGVAGPQERRGERALMAINPINPRTGLTRPVGATIDACRRVPDGTPAELDLLRPVPVGDPVAAFGEPVARSRGDTPRFKGVEFCTYGRLDVGVKDGSIVVIKVR